MTPAAQCFLLKRESVQEDWDEVLTQCRQALEINPRAARSHHDPAMKSAPHVQQ